MQYQRTLIGISSLLSLVVGLLLLWANDGQDTSVSGILVRVGVMLLVVWLGYPALMKSGGKQSLVWFVVLFGALFVVAFRPRLFLLVVVLAGLALAINWVWKHLNEGLGGR